MTDAPRPLTYAEEAERRRLIAEALHEIEKVERAMPWLMQGRGPKGHNF